jgi:hypothetical protein
MSLGLGGDIQPLNETTLSVFYHSSKSSICVSFVRHFLAFSDLFPLRGI